MTTHELDVPKATTSSARAVDGGEAQHCPAITRGIVGPPCGAAQLLVFFSYPSPTQRNLRSLDRLFDATHIDSDFPRPRARQVDVIQIVSRSLVLSTQITCRHHNIVSLTGKRAISRRNLLCRNRFRLPSDVGRRRAAGAAVAHATSSVASGPSVCRLATGGRPRNGHDPSVSSSGSSYRQGPFP
jgi:hypothetical protein